MKRCLLAGVVALSWLAAAVGPRAEAQFAGPPQVNPFGRPAVSPYLNLQRGGINPGVNYYGLRRHDAGQPVPALGRRQAGGRLPSRRMGNMSRKRMWLRLAALGVCWLATLGVTATATAQETGGCTTAGCATGGCTSGCATPCQ